MRTVSIVLPVYNGEKYLAESIKSILGQTFRNFELIVVNDCSTDSTERIVMEFLENDQRIRYIKNDVNSKLPRSINNGFAEATGKYWTWTSDDNIMHPNMIEKLVSYLDSHDNVDLVYTDYNQIDETGRFLGSIAVEPESAIYIKNVVGASFMYRSDIAKRIGGYDTDRFLVEDYEYWLRINLNGTIACLHECLYDYRIHGGSLTAKRQKEVQCALAKLRWDYLKRYDDSKLKPTVRYNYFNFLLGFTQNRWLRIAQRVKYAIKNPSYVAFLVEHGGKYSGNGMVEGKKNA